MNEWHTFYDVVLYILIIFILQSSIDTRITTENNHSILVIPKLLKKDTGAYTCRAENVYGSIMCTASINILPDWEIAEDFSSPTFVVTPETAKVMDGQPATFTCKVSNYTKIHNPELLY